MLQDHQLDTSELEGKSFDCLNGCAMCCTCQPELSDSELAQYKNDERLVKGLTNKHISGVVTEKPNAVKLQGGCGACYFLKSRRCQIYENRPQMCRQFPIHIHVLERIQLNANLSCRGIANDGGDSLLEYGRRILKGITHDFLLERLNASLESLRIFKDRCRDKGIYRSPGMLVSTAGDIIPLLSRPDGLGRLIAFAGEDPRKGEMQADEIAAAVLATPPPGDLDAHASEANYAQFELDDPAWLPIYVDENLRWNTFRSKNGAIEWMELTEDGMLQLKIKFDPKEIKLLPMDKAGLSILADYAKVLIGRDHFLGYTYYVCSDSGFNDDLVTVYLGVLGTALLDLWWRTSLIGKVQGRNIITGDLTAEGIISFDMDLLDAPTIGAFV